MSANLLQSKNAFLNRFPDNRRSRVANLFLNFGPRVGREKPADIVQAVRVVTMDCERRARDPQDADKSTQILQTIDAHMEEALSFAAWAVEYHHLPEQEREESRRGQQAEHVQRWLSNQPASEKQIAYLRSLGHKGEVVSKFHASQLIEQLQQAKGGHR